MATQSHPAIADPALPPGSLILISGINGFIASHIADQFLAYGYRVRGTARSAEKLAIAHEFLDRRHGHGSPAFEDAVVPDMGVRGAFEDAMKGCHGVAHVATDVSFGTDPNKVITPTVKAVEWILETAMNTPTVKRFVFSSSSSAATEPKPGVKFHIDASTWNTESSEIAWTGPPYDGGFDRAFSVYAASKTEAERAAWKYVDTHKPSFGFNTILPDFNMGPILSEQQHGSTGGWVRNMWRGDAAMTDLLRGFAPQYYVNVADNAKVHVAAMLMGDVERERLYTWAEPFNFNDLVNTMAQLEKEGMKPGKQLPTTVEGIGRDLSTVDTKRPLELLSRMGQEGWTGFRESTRDACRDSSAFA
ncbi:MAG: hypothetical protein M1828_004180 [Chrysothrix sp. TS-e1954]|nr:MAG: hypothetical protein M1828_004180 [Chrysothrix sp. TS-e1954]